jgi:sugar lactone lactonase YvrE
LASSRPLLLLRRCDGVVFPESPRWHDDAFWFSDIWGGQIYRICDNELEVVAACEAPSGIGWLPDGSLVVAAMTAQQLLRLEGGVLSPYVDLSSFGGHWCNDMLIDGAGRAYVGCTGGEPNAQTVTPAPLLVVDADRRACVAAADMMFPNGMAVSADGRRLYVAETSAGAITRFQVAPDGALSTKERHATLAGRWPDGIAIDALDRLWVADPKRRSLLRLDCEGTVELCIDMKEGVPLACAVGGETGDLLLVCMVRQVVFDDMRNSEGWVAIFKLDD